jgi:ribose-phosphate pyrophosphokinase
MILFYTKKYKELALKLEKESSGNIQLGQIDQTYFGDGERYLRVLNSVREKPVAILGSTNSDEDTLIIYDLATTLVNNGAASLQLIIPYFGYSTMERATKAGEVVTAKTRANLLSSIPVAHRGNSIVLIDLHVDGICHYFNSHLTPVHLYTREEIIDIVKSIQTKKEKIIACTDAGRAKWVESLANQLNLNAAFVFKKRTGVDQVAISGVSAEVKNKVVIIYDDMIRSGGSLIQAAKAYKKAGASEIYAITTHGVFSNSAISKIKDSKLFKRVYTSDTLPQTQQLKEKEFIQVFSVTDKIIDYLKEIKYGKSL